MFRTYKNQKIYKNFEIVRVFSVISLVFAFIMLGAFIIQNYVIKKTAFEFEHIYFMELLIFIPWNIYPSKWWLDKTPKETKRNNDVSNLRRIIILSFAPWLLSLFFFLIAPLSGWDAVVVSYRRGFAWLCGSLFLSHLWVYIADIFLIKNCVLIKREWKDDPPDFVKEKQAEMEQKKTRQVAAKNMEQYKTLIEKCGIKFFIKYYKPIKRLPLRDVEVSENYSSNEREERLLAAKKIIDLDLAEFTLNEILKSYIDILDENEIEQVKSILENETVEREFQKEKQYIDQEEKKKK